MKNLLMVCALVAASVVGASSAEAAVVVGPRGAAVVRPRPVVVAPRPVVVAPRPVVVAPARPVVVRPGRRPCPPPPHRGHHH